MNGILVIDKPLEWSSHDVVAQVRRVCQTRRVGHCGTLDPLATGVLVVCVGRATRLVEYVMGQPKTYLATVRLGQTTNTYDREGEIVAERPVPALTTEAVESVLDQFRGGIQQVPPMYSAIKKDGQPLYKLARKGERLDLPPRPVTIYELTRLHTKLPEIEMVVRCSTGTYIRSLAHDIGQALGCGGHLAALRRTEVGRYELAQAVPLAELTPENVEAWLLPPETAVAHLPQLVLDAVEIEDLSHGRFIAARSDDPPAEHAYALRPDGMLLGILLRDGERWRPVKMFLSD